MSNAVLEQQQTLDEHFTQHVDDDLDELHNRVAALEYEVKKARAEIDALRAALSEREDRIAAVLDAYKSIMSDLTGVIESQRDDHARHHDATGRAIKAIEGRLESERGMPVGPAAAQDEAPKRSSWPRRLFG